MQLAMTFETTPWQDAAIDLLAVPLFEGDRESETLRALDERMGGAIARLHEGGDFVGDTKDVAVLYPPLEGGGAARRIVLLGLGKRDKADLETLRRAAGAAVKRARALRAGTLGFLLTPEARSLGTPKNFAGQSGAASDARAARAVLDAASLAAYEYERYFTKRGEEKKKRPGSPDLTAIRLFAPGADEKAALGAARTAGIAQQGVCTARDLGNLPGNDGTPTVLAERAREVAQATGLSIEVLERADMERLGMGALLGVAMGSLEPPKMIILGHNPSSAPAGKKPIVLVGKGITFDSGGISIKPAESMEEMKFDKCGGCAVIGAMEAIARLALPLHVVGIVPACENLPSGTAQKPGDVRRAVDGQTIEIINTDAEGRLILADALAYAVQRYQPEAIVDLATLTGAIVVALGQNLYAGLFSNDEMLAGELRCAGMGTGEKLWPMPLDDDYDERIKSAVADVKNSGGRPGGSISAARFLKKFVKDVPWAHLDIAGTAWATEEKPYLLKGATGFGVRLLVEWLRAKAGA